MDPATIGLIGSGVSNLVGSIFSGIGASQQADAIKSASRTAKKRVKKFTNQFTEESAELLGNKLGILEDSANVFDRLGGFIFGDSGALPYLREAQADFAALAAGDFSEFQRELQSTVRGSLADTFGGPIGSFENLSARNIADLRNRGLANARTITSDLASLGSGLIQTEFGIYDQDFERRLKLGQYRTEALNQYDLMAAGQEGAGMGALGNIFTSAGQAISTGIGAWNTLQDAASVRDYREALALENQIRNAPRAQIVGPVGGGGFGGGFGGGGFVPPLPVSMGGFSTNTASGIVQPSSAAPGLFDRFRGSLGNIFSPQQVGGYNLALSPLANLAIGLGGRLGSLFGGRGIDNITPPTYVQPSFMNYTSDMPLTPEIRSMFESNAGEVMSGVGGVLPPPLPTR